MIRKLALSLVALLSLLGCEEENKNSLALSRTEIAFQSEGGEASLFIQTDAPEWKIQNPADWITLSPTNGTESSATITLSVDTKKVEPRSEVLTVLAGTADPVKLSVSQEAADYLYDMSVNYELLDFKKNQNSRELNITTDAPEWTITSDVDWLQFSPASGSGSKTITATALANADSEDRQAVVTIAAPYAPTATIQASQIGEYFPSYNTNPLPPDETGMTSTAMELSQQMTLGINIGNTLEAQGGSETSWGNPLITKELITAMKGHGFDAIRLPCAFDQYANSKTAKIRDEWLDRVKEVVQYCFDNDLYVIVNIHWDGGWLENNVNPGPQEEVNAKQKAFWEQIATHLRDFDERLIFASGNEPNVHDATQMAVLETYHQTFVSAVRSTGGKNTYRSLVVQGASTDIGETSELFKNFPRDPTPNKLMAELHYYTPYQFCLMEEDANWGNRFFYWGEQNHSTVNADRNATWGEEDDLDSLFQITHNQFVKFGYPVILGEFGAYKRAGIPEPELHHASVEYFNQYVTEACLRNGFIPFYWDTGGIIDRSTGAVKDQGVLDALRQGAGK